MNDPIVMKYYPKLLDEKDTLGWMERTQSGYRKYGHGFWIAESLNTGEFIGQIGLLPQIIEGEYHAELAYMIRSAVFGKGFATEAGKACLHFGFERLDRNKIVSMIRPENLPSRSVAHRLGLTSEKEMDWKGSRSLLHSINHDTFVKLSEMREKHT